MSDLSDRIAREHLNYSTGAEGPYCQGCEAPIKAVDGNYTFGWTYHVAKVTESAVLSGDLGQEDGPVTGWYALTGHEAFKPCFEEERPLVEAMLDRLTSLVETEAAVTELAAVKPNATMSEPLPVIAHKGPHDTDEAMFLKMASNLERGYPAGGGNATDALVRLIRREVQRAQTATCKPDRDVVARALIVASEGEAGGRAWDAPGPHGRTRWYNYADAALACLPGRTEAEVRAEALQPIRDALARHPKVCYVRSSGDPITCGWKAAVADVEAALRDPEAVKAGPEHITAGDLTAGHIGREIIVESEFSEPHELCSVEHRRRILRDGTQDGLRTDVFLMGEQVSELALHLDTPVEVLP